MLKVAGGRLFSRPQPNKTCSPPPFPAPKAVNNSRAPDKEITDFIGGFALFTRYPPARFGEQPVHIKSLSERRNLLECSQFIERTKRAVAINRLKLFVSRIIPGDWGKAGSGWLAGLLLNRTERCGSGGRIHQFLWHVRTCQMRMRDLAARGDEKLPRTESSSSGRFRA